jgi:hypothetical protein
VIAKGEIIFSLHSENIFDPSVVNSFSRERFGRFLASAATTKTVPREP